MSSDTVSSKNLKEKTMKVIIFGATGTIGKHLVNQSLENGFQVTAFSRNPKKLNITNPNLSLYPGDVFSLNTVADAVKGHDSVFIALGSNKLTGKVRSVGTQNIIQSMKLHRIKRLICQSTLGVGDSRDNLNFYWKYLMFGFILHSVYKDHHRQEALVKNSGLDWTIIRPAAFTDEASSSRVKIGFSSDEKNLALKIPRIDVAKYMLRLLKDNQYLHQTPGLSY